jgi:hypothetical protein
MELTKVGIHQIRIALTDIVDRLVHPRSPVIICGTQHSTSIDVTEQLVPSLREKLLLGHSHLPEFLMNG